MNYFLLNQFPDASLRITDAGILTRPLRRVTYYCWALEKPNLAKPIRIEDLADEAGMSLPAFHAHFRAITSLSPLQFLKQLRLIEAR